MNTATSLILGVVCLLSIAAAAVPVHGEITAIDRPAPGNSGKVDPHSYGNPEQVQIQQFELDLEVDFDEHG